MDALHQLEIIWILFVQGLGDWLYAVLNTASMLGTEDFYMIFMPSIYWCFDAVFGLRLGVMLLLSNGVNAAFKLVFHSPRPYWMNTQVKALASETSFGLPSGHAQHAASIWGLMASFVRSGWLKAGLVALIFLIGFSRIYLGVHYVSDVLVGWLIGSLLLLIFLRVEKPIRTWLAARSLREMLALSLATSVVLAALVLIPAATLGSWQTPAAWEEYALAAYPGNEIDPTNIDGAFTLSGTWLGFLAGAAWLYHRQGGFNADGTPGQRLLRYVVGLAGVFVFWFVLGRILPRSEDALGYALRYFRYALVGFWISALAPLLFERLGLVNDIRKKISPLSSGNNPL